MDTTDRSTLRSTVARAGVEGLAGAVAEDSSALRALIGLAITAERLLDGPDDRIGLERALGALGETLDFAGVAVWQHRTDEPGVYTVHARWRSSPVPVPAMVDVSTSGLTDAHEALLCGHSVEVWRASANADLRAVLDLYDDEGFLVVPVVGTECHWGAALFSLHQGDRRPWTTLSRTSLRTVAALFGSAVRRQQEAERAERLRLALEASEREEGLATLAAGIAHDVSNMLGVMRAGLDLAQLRGEFVEQDVVRMESAFGAATALVDQLYGFANLKSPEPVAVDLSRLLVRGEQLLATRLPANVDLVIDIDRDLARVRGSVTQVGQAIGNIVLNAIEAISETGGEVRVSARVDDRHGRRGVAILVTDDGPGVSPELREQLFKPLVSSKGARRGVGLASAASIARSHRGTLTLVDTDEPGARFELWLPTVDQPGDDEPSAAH